MNKTCNAFSPCQYRYVGSGSIGYGCNYEGYCDYQLPRDSRNTGSNRKEGKSPLNAKDFLPKEEGNMI